MSEARIQKLLASVGLGSRREIEQWITAGDVTVNGQLATLGQKVTTADRISVKGQPCDLSSLAVQTTEVLIYHKPLAEICARSDPRGRKTVFDHLTPPKTGRWINVGRLDYWTTGLLLFTNDGELAHQLMHPKKQVKRYYHVGLDQTLSKSAEQKIVRGVTLDDGERAALVSCEPQGKQWYRVCLTRGKYREVRRIFQAVGYDVKRLIRMQYGPIKLPKTLKAGQFQPLSSADIMRLKQTLQ